MYCPHIRNTNGFTRSTALQWWSPFGTGWSTRKHRDPVGPDGTLPRGSFPFPSGKHTKNYGKNSLLISMVIFHMLVITRGYIYIYMFHIDTHTTSGFFTRFHQLQGLTHRQKTIELSHSNPAGFEPPVVRFLRYIPGWWWLEPWNFYDFPFSWEWSPQLTNSYFSEGLKPPTNNH